MFNILSVSNFFKILRRIGEDFDFLPLEYQNYFNLKGDLFLNITKSLFEKAFRKVMKLEVEYKTKISHHSDDHPAFFYNQWALHGYKVN
jgi:hypothetical protein